MQSYFLAPQVFANFNLTPFLESLRLIFDPLEFNFNHIRPIHTFPINDIRIAPFRRESSTKLKHDDVRKSIMVKKPAEPCGVMSA